MKRVTVIIFALALAWAAWAGEWHIETVDFVGDVGSDNSLALDSSGYPHISYYYSNFCYDLKYARWDGDEWQVETVDWEEHVGSYTSLALDSNDYPHISYRDSSNDDLKYARWDGDEWQIETVDADLGTYGVHNSLALDGSDYPHISYYDYTNRDLKYARWDGDEWQIEIVDWDGTVGSHNSLALDGSDYPHISYYDYTNVDLKYAYWGGDEWQFEVVDPDGGLYTSLALDSSDYPRISYFCDDYGDLKYAWYDEDSAVVDAELSAEVCDEGVLVGWEITGDVPAGLRVLRGDEEPTYITGDLTGYTTRYLDRDTEPNGSYVYWLEVTEEDGTVRRFGPTEAVTVPEPTRGLSLSSYPNPAAGSVTVEYTLPNDGRVTISLYDLSGRRVDTLVDTETTTGRHEVCCDVSALPPGVYLAHLDTDAGDLTRRVVVSR
jgi:hypothetical protein